MADEVTPAKLRALQGELDTHGKVRFNGGATIEVVPRYKLTTPLGAVVIGTEKELTRLYEIALRGIAPLPAEQPATQAQLDRRYGEKAPW